MRNRYGLGGIARAAAIAVVALAITTPASAQFGGLKKKLKGAAAQEGASKAAGAAGVTPEAGSPTAGWSSPSRASTPSARHLAGCRSD